MSTTKLDRSGVFQPVTVRSQKTTLLLSTHEVCIRPNGIEFMAPEAFAVWTELTVDLRTADGPVHGTGVVVDCTGNRHTGYVVSLLFMGLNRESQARLILLAQSKSA